MPQHSWVACSKVSSTTLACHSVAVIHGNCQCVLWSIAPSCLTLSVLDGQTEVKTALKQLVPLLIGN